MQEQEALGRSKGGFSTKIQIQCEGLGKPMQFVVLPGQSSDFKGFGKLNAAAPAVKRPGRGRPKRRPRYLVGDKGYDSKDIRRIVRRQGTTPVIPTRRHVKRRFPLNRVLYRERNRIERLINRLKQARRIATRYEKRADNYLAMLTIGAILLWL
jgi:transposase